MTDEAAKTKKLDSLEMMKKLDQQAFEARMIKLGEAFRGLANDRERLDAVVGLLSVLKDRLKGQDGLFEDWMAQAHASAKGCLMLYREPAPAKKK